jgi:ethanolamine utilization microcompartment shell protein EutL
MLHEAEGWLHGVLALSGPAPVEAVTVCHFIASSVAAAQGANNLALQHAKSGFALAREAGDTFGEGLALMIQSGLLLESDLDGAEKANEAALACFLMLPGRPRMATCLLQRAAIAQLRGNYSQSTELAKKAY